LLFRKTELYSKDIKSFLVSIHTWEIIAPFIGAFLGLGLLFLSTTGFQMKKRRKNSISSEKEHIKEYSNDKKTVTWQSHKCIHAQECINRLPLVFDKDKEP